MRVLSLTVVVVVLRGELLGAQPVDSHDLGREAAGVHKAHGVEHDLPNQGVVWDHHSHCAKQHLVGGGGVSGSIKVQSSINSD